MGGWLLPGDPLWEREGPLWPSLGGVRWCRITRQAPSPRACLKASAPCLPGLPRPSLYGEASLVYPAMVGDGLLCESARRRAKRLSGLFGSSSTVACPLPCAYEARRAAARAGSLFPGRVGCSPCAGAALAVRASEQGPLWAPVRLCHAGGSGDGRQSPLSERASRFPPLAAPRCPGQPHLTPPAVRPC
jgi:hypothetical protein